MIVIAGLIFSTFPSGGVTSARAQEAATEIPVLEPIERLTETPTPQPTETSDPPAPVSASSYSWHTGTYKYSYYYDNGFVAETAYWVGYWTNPSDGKPEANQVYYVNVVAYNISMNPYLFPGDIWTSYFDIGLPANTLLQISSTNPVFCFMDGDPYAVCPQFLPASTENQGMYNIPWGNQKAWPMHDEVIFEFQIPVISTTTLSNSTLQAQIKITEFSTSSWLNPTDKVNVFPAFAKYSPVNFATNQPTNPTLTWASSIGAIRYEYCIDTSNNNTCNASWITVGTATSKALSGLTPGTVYYWQVRVVKSQDTTYANGGSTAFWSFTVAANTHRIYLPLVKR
jgi:hypothetical protein